MNEYPITPCGLGTLAGATPQGVEKLQKALVERLRKHAPLLKVSVFVDAGRAMEEAAAALASKPLPQTDDVRARARDIAATVNERKGGDEFVSQAIRAGQYDESDTVQSALLALSAQSPPPADDDVERVARALFEVERASMEPKRRRPTWENELPEFRAHMLDKARAAIAAMPVQSPKVRIVRGSEVSFEENDAVQIPPPIMGEGLDWKVEVQRAIDFICGLKPYRARLTLEQLLEKAALATAPASALRMDKELK